MASFKPFQLLNLERQEAGMGLLLDVSTHAGKFDHSADFHSSILRVGFTRTGYTQ
jgi:hypothetical protein